VSCGYRDAAADYSRRVSGLGTTIGRVRPSISTQALNKPNDFMEVDRS